MALRHIGLFKWQHTTQYNIVQYNNIHNQYWLQAAVVCRPARFLPVLFIVQW